MRRLLWPHRNLGDAANGPAPVKAFTEQDERISRPRGLLTVRACWWAIGQLRAEHASALTIEET